MSHGLINPADSLEQQNEKLLTIAAALMRRVEQSADAPGAAYAQFQRAALLEEEVRSRTGELEHALDLLNSSNAQLERANRATEAARADLANAIEAVREGFALFSPDDRLVLCNSRFGMHMPELRRHLQPGLAFGDYVAQVAVSPALDLPPGDTAQGWATNRMNRHAQDHVLFNVALTGDRWLQVSEHRTPTGGTVVLQTDVTGIMRRQLQERERMLDDQARLIRATLEHLNQGVCIFDGEGCLVGRNTQASALLSVPLSRFELGTPFATLFAGLSGAMPMDRLQGWMAAGDQAAPLSDELSLPGPRVLTLFAEKIPTQGFVISFTDISQERAATQAAREANETLERRVVERTLELQDALAEAERANQSKSRFVAAASHDLLQPLSAAKLFLSTLDAGTDQRATAAKAARALSSVESIIEALLDISKLDAGRATVHLSPVRIDRLLAQLADEMTPPAVAKGLDLRVVPCRAVVISDATYLRRILQNLISNAIRYTVSGRVLVGARRLRDAVRLEVWDTGPGIPEAARERVFGEFQRLDAAASAAEGMGLGLSIVERACALLHHPLNLISTEGRGSVFQVTVPLDGAPARGGLAMVVGKADCTAEIIAALEAEGIDTLSAPSAAEAEALLAELDLHPDVVLCGATPLPRTAAPVFWIGAGAAPAGVPVVGAQDLGPVQALLGA
ncbi:sensor histidine kinase [Actibacterium mucosum]|uniref:sensor histidine kinase n=1 Tax=Actibacterium mucosum TaxID=1087332 RepID=UPI0009DE36B6|nr:PAS domain-containing sensor histidine kinase [Actibacterium mucosum]